MKNILLANNIEVVVHLVSTLIPGSTYDDYINEFKNVIFPSIELMEFCADQKSSLSISLREGQFMVTGQLFNHL